MKCPLFLILEPSRLNGEVLEPVVNRNEIPDFAEIFCDRGTRQREYYYYRSSYLKRQFAKLSSTWVGDTFRMGEPNGELYQRENISPTSHYSSVEYVILRLCGGGHGQFCTKTFALFYSTSDRFLSGQWTNQPVPIWSESNFHQ